MQHWWRHLSLLLAAVAFEAGAEQSAHPRLLLAPADVAEIKESIDESPGFARSLGETRSRLDQYFEAEPDVPVPADAGGGYTHERHKKNGVAIHDAGMVYQLTGDASYAARAERLLLAYAELYPSLSEHPKKKEQTPGRLFWQSLNEAVWLVYAIQGYDAIHDTLSEATRARIERDLLRPMADFLSIGQPQTFDKIHNHGTWAVAAVGMTGYVLADEDYVRKSLYGLKRDGSAGFIRQLDELFSPDGYYTEGPYYQRYALMPFVLFARSISANDPELEIFEHRDRILLKAIYACVDLSYAGLFFPINDAIKDKGLDTVELRYGIAVAYALTGDPTLLSVAQMQKSLVLTADGFKTARAIDAGKARPFEYRSVSFSDGANGKQGMLAVLRSGAGANQQALVLKATAQGMGHGHFDKLHWLFYDNGNEIVTDYGAARFLNVEQKYGGHYLPENKSWAKQTIAHNTLVVDERSHFDGKLTVAERHHPSPLYFTGNDDLEIAAARMRGAYDGVEFSRTMALLKGITPGIPVVVDVIKVSGSQPHQYDLPLHFNGQVIGFSKALEAHTDALKPLGDANGYQHLWLRAQASVAPGEVFSLTWLTGDRFYTLSALAETGMSALMAELGANDPNFNLRREQALILRADKATNLTFVSVLEPHGEYNGPEEFTVESYGRVTAVQRHDEGGADLIRLVLRNGGERLLGLSYNPDAGVRHSVSLGNRVYEWRGYFAVFDR